MKFIIAIACLVTLASAFKESEFSEFLFIFLIRSNTEFNVHFPLETAAI